MNGHGPTNSYSLPGGSDGKESGCNAGDPGLIPGSVRSHGEGNGYPLQYFCPENPMDRGAWWSTVHGVAKSQTQLNDYHTHTHTEQAKNLRFYYASNWGL